MSQSEIPPFKGGPMTYKGFGGIEKTIQLPPEGETDEQGRPWHVIVDHAKEESWLASRGW